MGYFAYLMKILGTYLLYLQLNFQYLEFCSRFYKIYFETSNKTLSFIWVLTYGTF